MAASASCDPRTVPNRGRNYALPLRAQTRVLARAANPRRYVSAERGGTFLKMALFHAHLTRAVDSLRRRQRQGNGPHGGGWGVLLEANAPSSIVNTAEAISLFAMAGEQLDDPSVSRGLE